MLSEIQSKQDSHLEHIKIAKHRIELLDQSIVPVQLTSYRAGPRTREFQNVESEKVLDENISKPAQTEQAAATVFVLKITKTL